MDYALFIVRLDPKLVFKGEPELKKIMDDEWHWVSLVPTRYFEPSMFHIASQPNAFYPKIKQSDVDFLLVVFFFEV